MLKSHVDIEVITDALKKFYVDPVNKSRDFIDFVNKDSHLVLYGKADEDNYRLLSGVLEGRGESPIQRSLESSCSSTRTDTRNPFQLFFASNLDFNHKIFDNFFTASLEDYEDKFEELKNERFFRVGDPESKSNFHSWEDLKTKIYVSDVILIDPFIINTDKEEILENNLYKLLRQFSSHNTIKSVLIFTKPSGSDAEKQNVQFDSIVLKCREILGRAVVFGIINFDYFLNEHDRYVITNYQYIQSGNSFSSIFDTSGNIRQSNTSTIKTSTLAQPENYQHMNDVLKRMKQSLDAFHEKNEKLQFINSRLFYHLRKE